MARVAGQKVVVLGGGIAGLEAAIDLRKAGFSVTLVSNRKNIYIYPISIWIPVHKIDFEDACLSLDMLAARHGFTLIVEQVIGIEAGAGRVRLQNRILDSYDFLVVAVGAGKLKPKADIMAATQVVRIVFM